MPRAGNTIAQLGYVIPIADFRGCFVFWQKSTGIAPLNAWAFHLDNQISRGTAGALNCSGSGRASAVRLNAMRHHKRRG